MFILYTVLNIQYKLKQISKLNRYSCAQKFTYHLQNIYYWTNNLKNLKNKIRLHKRFFLSFKYPQKIFDIIIYKMILLRNVFN